MSVDFHLGGEVWAVSPQRIVTSGTPWGHATGPPPTGQAGAGDCFREESKVHIPRQQTSMAHCNSPLRPQAPPPLQIYDYLKYFTNRTLPKEPSPIFSRNSRSEKLHLQRCTGISALLPLWRREVPLLEGRWEPAGDTPDLFLRLEPAMPSWATMELSRRSCSSSGLGLETGTAR
jgi:hypothetical protein